MSIRTRLTLWYSILLSVVLILFGVALLRLLNWAWQTQIDSSLNTIGNQIAPEAINGMTYNRPVKIAPISDSMSLSPYYLQVWATGNVLLGTSDPDRITPLDPSALGSVEEQRNEFYADDGHHYYVLTSPVIYADGRPPGAIQVATRLDAVDVANHRLAQILVVVGLVAIVMASGVGFLIAGQALQPVETIAQTAEQITAADDLSRRIEYDGPDDELGRLIHTFNATLERLETLFNTQRRFVADVSHELRTPLTTLRGNLDLIQRFGTDADSLHEMNAELSRMTRMVSDLLLLARADSGNLPMNETVLDLDTLMMEVFRQAQTLAQQSGQNQRVVLDKIQPARVRGDMDRLKQVLLNLVTNALKYTPPDGTITLGLITEGDQAQVSVSDTGIGIPAESLPHIFDRFYRVDTARARIMGGTGLGLAIVHWIVRAHNGTVTVHSTPGQGSTFCVNLPLLPDETVKAGGSNDSHKRETRLRMRTAPPSISVLSDRKPPSLLPGAVQANGQANGAAVGSSARSEVKSDVKLEVKSGDTDAE